MHLLPDESILNGRGRYSIGAINENKPCGVVSFELGDVTADIDWLYVSEDARRQGAGRLLLDGVRDALDKTSLMGVSAHTHTQAHGRAEGYPDSGAHAGHGHH